MELATFEAFYSRPIAPTRRIALGAMELPVDPAPGFGGVLLAGIVARFARELDSDTDEELDALLDDLEAGRRIRQPRIRHRLQHDTIGLAKCRHRLVGSGEQVRFVFDTSVGTPTQHVLCAVYAASAVPPDQRATVVTSLRRGLGWIGAIDESLVRYLSNRSYGSVSAGVDPVGWAIDRLSVDSSLDGEALHAAVSKSFRDQLLRAHPDHGGSVEHAADVISELREARRVLLGR